MIGKTNLSGSKVTINNVPVNKKTNLIYKNETYYDSVSGTKYKIVYKGSE